MLGPKNKPLTLWIILSAVKYVMMPSVVIEHVTDCQYHECSITFLYILTQLVSLIDST